MRHFSLTFSILCLTVTLRRVLVPALAPPNEHSSNDHVLFLTKKLAEHLVPSGSGSGVAKVKTKPKVYQFLRKAKGTQSATLDLSWA